MPVAAQAIGGVMPAFRATNEGDTSTTVLVGPERRYQQLELEARGRAFVVQGIELRRDGRWTGTVLGRSVDLALAIGAGDRDAFGRDFAANWVGSPTVAIPTRRVNLPALPRPGVPPAPFAIRLPFATTVVHTGRHDLLWEVGLATTDRSAYPVDAESTTELTARLTNLGSGCRDRVRRVPMFLSFALFARIDQVTMSLAVQGVPSRQPVALMLGTADPIARPPRFCTFLRSNASVVLPLGSADASGSLRCPAVLAGPWQPRWVGRDLYVQAISTAFDNSPFWLSNGYRATMPQENPAPESQRVLIASRLAASTGFVTPNFGAVVRFH